MPFDNGNIKMTNKNVGHICPSAVDYNDRDTTIYVHE